jgi:hypothetical protein
MDQRPGGALDYGPYSWQSGTSMAAAFVTGAIAKIWSVCESCTALEVESCITSTTMALSEIHEGCVLPVTSVGVIQAEAAYNCLRSTLSCC